MGSGIFFRRLAIPGWALYSIYECVSKQSKVVTTMNARQLQYAVLLAQVRNFSQVAEQLNISQPALSKQILSLEKDLGLKLFDRNTSPLTLTPAGEFFVREARELLYKEDQLLRAMERFRSGENGHLVIGSTPFRSLYMLPPMVRQFKQRYPGIQVVLHEMGSDILRKEAAEGKFDFAVVNRPVDESILDVIPLEPDMLALAVPNELVPLIPGRTAGVSGEVDFRDCGNLPFVVLGQSQEMRQLFDKLCNLAEFHPNIAAEVVGISTAWAMAHAGVGAALMPLQFVAGEKFDQNMTLFTIKDTPFPRHPVIVTRRGQHLPEYAKYAIELLKDLV